MNYVRSFILPRILIKLLWRIIYHRIRQLWIREGIYLLHSRNRILRSTEERSYVDHTAAAKSVGCSYFAVVFLCPHELTFRCRIFALALIQIIISLAIQLHGRRLVIWRTPTKAHNSSLGITHWKLQKKNTLPKNSIPPYLYHFMIAGEIRPR